MKPDNEKQAIEEMVEISRNVCECECFINDDGLIDCDVCRSLHFYDNGYRKQSVGKWVWADDGYCRCSVCTQKAPVTTQYQDEPMTTATKYCPNCGARMKGATNENN